MLRCVFIIECGIARFLCAVRVFEVRASSSSHGYLCAPFRFFAASTAELAHEEKSRTQSLTHSLNKSFNHPAYLMRREPKLSLRNNHAYTTKKRSSFNKARNGIKTTFAVGNRYRVCNINYVARKRKVVIWCNVTADYFFGNWIFVFEKHVKITGNG